jgi:hypothetical protein
MCDTYLATASYACVYIRGEDVRAQLCGEAEACRRDPNPAKPRGGLGEGIHRLAEVDGGQIRTASELHSMGGPIAPREECGRSNLKRPNGAD